MTNHGLEAAKRQIGKRRDEVSTPALLLDLPKARQNIAEMANRMAKVPAALRPHVKIHKNPGLGKMQIAAGALEPRAIKSPQRPRANDGIRSLHGLQRSKIQFVLLCLRSVVLEETGVGYPKIL